MSKSGKHLKSMTTTVKPKTTKNQQKHLKHPKRLDGETVGAIQANPTISKSTKRGQPSPFSFKTVKDANTDDQSNDSDDADGSKDDKASQKAIISLIIATLFV